MEALEPGLIPVICLIAALTIPVAGRLTRGGWVIPYIAVLYAVTVSVLAIGVHLAVSKYGVVLYRFGGFPQSLSVLYVVDEVSSVLALLTSFALVTCISYSSWLIDRGRLHYFYSLTFLLAMGVYGCLYTGDLFNFYVSVELVAIASYALTAFYSEKGRPLRAALIYGLFGTIMTSMFLLAVVLVYGSYGTLNVVDLMLKASDPYITLPLSGRVYGDIVATTKVSMALITWVLFFKSGIIPNHFWLPEVYRHAPLPTVAFFSASADVLGVYGLFRLYHTVFTEECVISDFRASVVSVILLIGVASTLLSSAITARQRSIRGLVAYSSITQYSLALLGIAAGVPESVAGATLHLITNALGDMLVLFSSGLLLCIRNCSGSTALLARISLVAGLLNLFGVIPILPGFWSKAILTLGFTGAGMYFGAVVVLMSSGLCALGYLTTMMAVLGQQRRGVAPTSRFGTGSRVPVAVLVTVLISVLCLGLALTLGGFRELVLVYGVSALDRGKFLELASRYYR